ncbi:MAG: hypothetical protein CFE21_16015 [Bacteroidetes bacterium B1(2017)]|nr:MAG: hypothetical protein CFE21_16015 [Bacteroidetes bacterium B1(2017)]
MNQILWIALGGAIGAVLRYTLALGITSFWPIEYPIPTLLVNLLGCFAIGAVYAAFATHANFQETLRPFLIIGVLGGFTTFSSFAMESVELLKSSQHLKAFSYIALSNFIGILAAYMGFKLFTI